MGNQELPLLGGLNLYGFDGNNPVNMIDPDGKKAKGIGKAFGTGDNCEIVGGVIGATAGFAGATATGVASVGAFRASVVGGSIGGALGGLVSDAVGG